MKTEYKHIYFDRDIQEEIELKRKTQIWIIWNRFGQVLGRIEWDCGWRQYCSFTENIKLSASCHDDISHFIKQLMNEKKTLTTPTER